jgi:outer membrane receptor for ferrienterochelin and colicins
MIREITVVLAVVAIGLTPGVTVAGEISGRVTDSETLNPVDGATIRVLETGKTTPSDKYGNFKVDGLADGTYRIIASHITFDRSDTLFVTVSGTAHLDIRMSPTPWVLNGVVVTGTRSPHLLKNVPVQTEVVTSRDFRRTGSTTVDEALASSVGIKINDDVSGKGASIRGIEADRVLILVDGERSVGRVRGSIDLGQFSLTNVERIEVVKGTGSTLYGSEAMGGVINIITRKPRWNEGKASMYLDYGTHNSYNPSATLEYGSDRVGISLGGKLSSTDGFDLDESTPHTNGEDDTRRWNLDSKVRAGLSDKWIASASGRFMSETKKWIEYEEIDALNKYTYDDVETNKRYEGSVSAQYISGDKYSMNVRLFGTHYNHHWNKFNGPYWVDTSDTREKFYEISYSSNYVIAREHVITYGFDVNRQDLTSPGLVAEKKADRALDGYFQYEYSPIKSLNFLPGVRYENHSSFGGHVNPSINIMYKAGEQIKLRGFVGKGFRAPSIKQQ